MKKMIFGALVGGLLVALALTMPTQEQHLKAIAGGGNAENASALDQLVVGLLASTSMTYNTYVFFSTLSTSSGVISYGLLGHVVVVDEPKASIEIDFGKD